MDCKIISRLFILIILLTTTQLNAIEFKGKFLQGHYIVGITDPAAKIIIGKINAFSPSPGCWFKYQGVRFKIIDAKEVDASGTPGQIINKHFTIACSKNAIQILVLQKEGKKVMSAIDFLKGNEIEIGSKLT